MEVLGRFIVDVDRWIAVEQDVVADDIGFNPQQVRVAADPARAPRGEDCPGEGGAVVAGNVDFSPLVTGRYVDQHPAPLVA